MKSNLIRQVEVVANNHDWPRAFQLEAEMLQPLFEALFVACHHIGSTSIPGAAAKPIIDILIEVTDIVAIEGLNVRLAELGYEAMGENGIPGRRFFQKDAGARRTHHIHVFQQGNPEIYRHRAFCDYLVRHPDALCAYSRLKSELAARHPTDITAYIAGKDAFVKDIDRKAADRQC